MHIVKIFPSEWRHIVSEDWMFADRICLNGLSRANGGQLNLLRKAHNELKIVISRGVEYAKIINCSIDEVAVVTEVMMDASTFGGWIGTPWDNEANYRKLAEWFHSTYSSEFNLQIVSYDDCIVIRFNDAALDIGDNVLYTSRKCEPLLGEAVAS